MKVDYLDCFQEHFQELQGFLLVVFDFPGTCSAAMTQSGRFIRMVKAEICAVLHPFSLIMNTPNRGPRHDLI